MKIAVLSDVHGNLPALQAVLEDLEAWSPDEVIVNGDLVNRGPCSLACLRLVEARLPRCRLLKGNHEAFVLKSVDAPRTPSDPLFELERMAVWTAAQMSDAVEELRRWGDHFDVEDVHGSSVHVTHGSRLGYQKGIYPETSDEELQDKLGERRDLFIGSHTHRPLVRRFDGTLVVNVGSVGQPLDGDPRGAYGRFVFQNGDWQVNITRIPYDKSRAERDFVDSGFLGGAGALAHLIQRELQESQPHIAPWRKQYMQAVQDGRITLTEAVQRYLRAL